MDLARAAAYSNKTPYDLWQESEGIPILRGHCVEDLTAIPVAPWKRTGVRGSFINLVGSGRTCSAYVLEIPPRSETQPRRGGTQIDYKDQDPEVHATFLAECKQRNTQVRLAI